MQLPRIQLDVISDTVCPWCYIGKKRLDRTLAGRSGLEVDLRWRPFQLDPTIPAEGVDRRAYMEKKFGTERAKEAGDVIRELGEQEGIGFAFDKIERSPNTLDSHRLIRWAGTAGCQDAVVELLFHRYFEEGANIGDYEVLIAVAGEAGMDAEIVRDLLRGEADVDLVRREDMMARQMGIQGVPAFIMDGKYALVGAQEPETLNKVFDKFIAKMQAGASADAPTTVQ